MDLVLSAQQALMKFAALVCFADYASIISSSGQVVENRTGCGWTGGYE